MRRQKNARVTDTMASTPSAERRIREQWTDFYNEYCSADIQDCVSELQENPNVSGVPLVVDYENVAEFSEEFGLDIQTSPKLVMAAAKQAFLNHSAVRSHPDIGAERVTVRLDNHPTIQVRDLTPEKLGTFISVEGVVQQATDPKPRFVEMAFECQRCATVTRVRQPSNSLLEPHECPGCDRQGPFTPDMTKTTHAYHQRVRIQEPPEGLRGGKDPRSVDVHIEGDLVDVAAPGDQAIVTGYMTYPDPTKQSGDEPLAETYIDANNITVKEDSTTTTQLTDEEETRIRDIAGGDNPLNDVVESIAPTVYGYPEEKLAVALQMFSGVQKSVNDKSVRGDIHVFLVGDPGTAKSQLLHFVSNVIPRSVYTTGEGSSKAGLTGAAVQSDLDSGAWSVEAGVLVLSDKGIACVDELDKLDDGTDALHSALEQQQVSIAKAGINTTMNARCGLLAAANPKFGRWDEYTPVPEQVDLPPAIISRFDLIFVMRDIPDTEFDSELASSILDTNQAGEKIASGETLSDDNDHLEPEIPSELFPKYITYARNHVTPTLTEEAKTKMKEFYVDMRSSAAEDSGAIPVTARKLEALVRLAEASARIRLSESINEKDAQLALDIVTHSLKQVGVDPETGELDADTIEANVTTSQRNRIKQIGELLQELERERDGGVPIEELRDTAEERGMDMTRFDKEIRKLKDQGLIYSPRAGKLSKT